MRSCYFGILCSNGMRPALAVASTISDTACSLLSETCVPAHVAMETLGHSDTRITRNLHTHVDDAAKIQAADAMEYILGGQRSDL